jgi:hypothetical protein
MGRQRASGSGYREREREREEDTKVGQWSCGVVTPVEVVWARVELKPDQTTKKCGCNKGGWVGEDSSA